MEVPEHVHEDLSPLKRVRFGCKFVQKYLGYVAFNPWSPYALAFAALFVNIGRSAPEMSTSAIRLWISRPSFHVHTSRKGLQRILKRCYISFSDVSPS